MPKSKIIRVIPDRIFYKLWKAAEEDVKIYDYIDAFMSPLSDTYIDFRKKYKLDEMQVINLLENVYKAARLSMKDIIDAAGRRKADVGYMFCIPIRTLEDWCSGKNKSPSYVRLMMIRKFNLLNLGKYIYLESDNHMVYNAYKGCRKRAGQKDDLMITDSEKDEINSVCNSGVYKNDYMVSMKEYEQLHIRNNSNGELHDIIAATDYLREYMKEVKIFGGG